MRIDLNIFQFFRDLKNWRHIKKRLLELKKDKRWKSFDLREGNKFYFGKMVQIEADPDIDKDFVISNKILRELQPTLQLLREYDLDLLYNLKERNINHELSNKDTKHYYYEIILEPIFLVLKYKYFFKLFIYIILFTVVFLNYNFLINIFK